MPKSAQRYRGQTLSGLRLRRLRARADPPPEPPGCRQPTSVAGESPLDDLLGAHQIEPEQVAAAAASEAVASEEEAYGRLGAPLDRRSPFWIGVSATFGVAVAGVVLLATYYARNLLLLFGLSLFIAAGLDPVVVWLHRRMPRPVAVGVVIVLGLALAGGIGDLAVPVLVKQVTTLAEHLPRYFRELNDRSSLVGRVNTRYHVESRLRAALANRSSGVASGLLGLGRAVLGALASALVVVVVSTYLLFDLPRFKRLVYGLVPRSRRARAVLLGDQIFAKVGG